ncbi:MAG: energy-coupling factor transporter transmembrane protein EcfT [Oscillospiraceae bacterium]|jgi:energy-coupling factor transport system permease protein|nr:energy-coupling factor transporter transmembrane protein EcfT [Oscillospiraceae bacterium]
MLKDITLGQYFPGDTVIHRLDPRTKLIWTVLYIVALFLAKSYSAYFLMAALLTGIVAASRISARTIFKGLRPVVIIIAFTAVLNIFFTGGTVLLEFWVIKITREGLVTAALMVLRLVMLITGTFLLTYTTSPLALTDGIEALFNPLKKIKLPVHELAMMMSIALRFIPTLIEETDKIMSAQKARGADFETGNLLRRAKAMLPILVPLFISAFRRADELAEAMESRCYHGGEGRTRMKKLGMARRDYAALALGAASVAAVSAANLWLL